MKRKDVKYRDRVAVNALNGMLAHSTRYRPREGEGYPWHLSIAKEAYEIADAMLSVKKETERRKEK